MNAGIPSIRATLVLAAAVLAGCQSAPPAEGPDAVAAVGPVTDAAPAVPAGAHVVDVLAEDFAFEAPQAIPSGWTTFRLENVGEETHFLYVTRLPADRTFDEYVRTVGGPIGELWRQIREGETGKAAALEALGAAIPAWYWTDTEVYGGPGLIAPGGVSQVTVELEPGTYVLECFMKTAEGEFHWAEGMIRPIEVLEERSSASRPAADLEMRLTAEGYVMDGELRPGSNTVALHFDEQPDVGFGNDAHLVRLEDGMEPARLVPWMDAFNVEGLENPAPATFVGGTHERPEGATIYFTVDVEPGRYAWMSEGPEERRFFREFTVR